MPSTHWHPTTLFTSSTPPETPYSILILNQPLNTPALTTLLPHAKLLICADGGANRLYTYHESLNDPPPPPPPPRTSIPYAIVGDLDSLNPDVRKYYSRLGVPVIHDADQYSTDFTKALKYIRHAVSLTPSLTTNDDGIMDVIVMGGLGGRVDQGFSQIHHLYMAERDESLLKGRIYLLSEQSLSFVLSESPSPPAAATTTTNPGIAAGNDEAGTEETSTLTNSNIIYLPTNSSPSPFAENIGILPILGPSTITTKGLEWDVENWRTEFGGQVSTSNHIRAEMVEIAFGGPRLLFTVELARHLRDISD